jgi:hypothetical protein
VAVAAAAVLTVCCSGELLRLLLTLLLLLALLAWAAGTAGFCSESCMAPSNMPIFKVGFSGPGFRVLPHAHPLCYSFGKARACQQCHTWHCVPGALAGSVLLLLEVEIDYT